MQEAGDPIVYFQGRFVPVSEATVSILAPVITRGPVPYETLRGYWNSAEQELFLFRLPEHFRRLRASMRTLRYKDLFDAGELTAIVCELVRLNGLREDIHFRLFVYPREQEKKRYATTLSGIVIDVAPRPAKEVKPIVCATSPWRRGGDDTQPARIKAMGIRMFVRAAMDQAIEDGYDQLILMNERGKLSESVQANLFLVKDGVLVTPPGTASLLEGVTRATLLDLAAAAGIPAVERDAELTELYDADEAFLCSTGLEVLPIASVDRIGIGDSAPGPVTLRLQALYKAALRGQDPAVRHWLTPVYGR